MGDTGSYAGTIQRNVDEQIARFLDAWRAVNPGAGKESQVAS
jgi:hypothetical protein